MAQARGTAAQQERNGVAAHPLEPDLVDGVRHARQLGHARAQRDYIGHADQPGRDDGILLDEIRDLPSEMCSMRLASVWMSSSNSGRPAPRPEDSAAAAISVVCRAVNGTSIPLHRPLSPLV